MNLMWTNVAHTRARTEHHVWTQQVAQFFLHVTLKTGSAVALQAWFSVVILVLFLALRCHPRLPSMRMRVRALMVSADMSVK